MAWSSEINPGLFVPTTNVWDVEALSSVDVTSPEFKELLVRLYQNVNNISIALNLKDTGYYVEEEFVNGQVYPPVSSVAGASPPTPRQVFRKLIDFGALPNAATKNVAHGITANANMTFTRIYGAASNKVANSYIPLPYSSPTLNQNISLSVTATNISITTGINMAAYTDTWIIVEFLKS